MLRRRLLPLTLAPCLAVVASAFAPHVAQAADAAKPAWRTEKHILEIGYLIGAFFPAKDHGLYGISGDAVTQRTLKTGFDIGLRIAYLPLRFVGIELEGHVVPTKATWTQMDGKDRSGRATMYGLRGHLILQLPTRLSLFIVGGGGMLGVASKTEVLGKNVDPSLHVGGGLKYYITKRIMLRIDGRDVITPSYTKDAPGGQAWAHNAEFTFGGTFVLGRQSPKMYPKG